jgi:predicted Zn-dependent protease
MKQTAVECLKQDIDSELKHGTKMVVNWDMYLQMEKQQIQDAYKYSTSQFSVDARIDYTKSAEQYYNETFNK